MIRSMAVAPDLKALLPQRTADVEDEDDRPLYYLWTFNPVDGEVYMDHNEDKHPAHHVTHDDLAPHVHHPEKVHGYAYSIKDGWRITDDEHKEVKDPCPARIEKASRRAPRTKLASHQLSSDLMTYRPNLILIVAEAIR